jgi:hypothetical protein
MMASCLSLDGHHWDLPKALFVGNEMKLLYACQWQLVSSWQTGFFNERISENKVHV